MIDAIAKRRVTVNGQTYQKNDIIPMPLMQFKDLEPTGFVERAPRRRAAKVEHETVTHQPIASTKTVRVRGAPKSKPTTKSG